MECPPRTGEGPASGDRALVVAEVLQRRLALRAPHLGSGRGVASYYIVPTHPLYTRLANMVGVSVPEPTMRPPVQIFH
jgi:hypothetical protein